MMVVPPDLPCPPLSALLISISVVRSHAEMNVAWAMHEGIADYLVPCLFWLRSGGKLDLRWLASKLTVTRLSKLTADRVYPAPFPPMPPRPRPPSPSPHLQPPPSPVRRPAPPGGKRNMAGSAADRAPPTPLAKR